MDSMECLRLDEIESLLNYMDFAESVENDTEIDIIQLPPDQVDAVSDLEDIDEDDLGNDCVVRDVPGRIEIHFLEKDAEQSDKQAALGLLGSEFEPSNSRPNDLQDCDSPPKRKRLKTSSNDLHAPSTSQAKTRPSKKIPTVKNPTKPKTKTCEKNNKKSSDIDIDWKKEQPNFALKLPPDDFIPEHRAKVNEELKNKTPVEVFETLFDETIMEHIVQESKNYAVQQNRHDFSFTKNCFRKFLGILLFSGYYTLPQEHLYWSEDEDMSTQCVRKCLSKNRWNEIKRNLHFNDNRNILPDGSNKKCFKIAPLYDMLNKSFMQF